MRAFLLISIVCTTFFGAFCQNFSGGFTFSMPYNDSTVSNFLPSFSNKPITLEDKVSVSGKNFIVKGQPYRFWGGNMVANGAMPEKSLAPNIAAHAAKMGINLLRFHHLDNSWAGDDGSLFMVGQSTRLINAVSRDKMEYLIYQFKLHGIYTNMNLNVGRTFNSLDGVPDADSLLEFAKGPTIFDPQLIALQKEYASQLLNHINPYTGLKLALDPALAMVEIINENTLYGMWESDELTYQSQGGYLTARHHHMLDSLWNAFLVVKYGNHTNLTNAWQVPATFHPELIVEGDFQGSSLHANWQNELHNGTTASFQQDVSQGYNSSKSALISNINTDGTDWHIQFKHVGFTLQKDTLYKVSFYAKAASPRNIGVGLMQNGAPYTYFGGDYINLTSNWQFFTFNVLATENAINDGRLTFSMGESSPSVWIDNVSVKQPDKIVFLPGENLTQLNIKRNLYSQRGDYSGQRIKDLAIFYISLQKNFLEDMRSYLRNTLGVTAPITGNNALTGIQDGFEIENMDFCDDHAYWDHPYFPGEAWDPNNWSINNTPMLNNNTFEAMSTALSGIGLHNKPTTISEYNHAAPNRFRVEMVPAMAAYGSFHGLGGVMFYDYSDAEAGSWTQDKINGYFAINKDHSVMSLFPSTAYAFRNFLIAEGSPFLINYAEDDIYNSYLLDDTQRWGKYTPYDKKIQLSQVIKTGTWHNNVSYASQNLPTPQNATYTTSTGQTILNTTSGVLTTSTPKFVSITGYLNNIPNTTVGDLTLINGNNFGAITWLSKNANTLVNSDTSFLTIAARQQNIGMVWANNNTTINNNWGSPPTQQMPLTVTLRFNVNAQCLLIHTLSNTGQRLATKVATAVAPNLFESTFNQSNDQTLWYGLESLQVNDAEWLGSVSSDWFNPANWSCGLLPGPASNVIIRNNKPFYPIVNATVSVYSLNVSQGANITVANGVHVNILGQ